MDGAGRQRYHLSDQGMAEVGGVNSDLVGSPGLDPEAEQGMFRTAIEDLDLGASGPPAGGDPQALLVDHPDGAVTHRASQAGEPCTMAVLLAGGRRSARP